MKGSQDGGSDCSGSRNKIGRVRNEEGLIWSRHGGNRDEILAIYGERVRVERFVNGQAVGRSTLVSCSVDCAIATTAERTTRYKERELVLS